MYQYWLKNSLLRVNNSEISHCDSYIFIIFVTGHSRYFFFSFGEQLLIPIELTQLEVLLELREIGEPVFYLIGIFYFYILLSVSHVTILPRKETEHIIYISIKMLPNHPCAVLDLGTGTGSIALALSRKRKNCAIIGIDRHYDSVLIAKHNEKKIEISHVHFLQGIWFSPLDNTIRFSFIFSNPPYIYANDPHLKIRDLFFEPKSALVSEQYGIYDITTIIHIAPQYLLNKGWLLIEHSWQQGTSVRALMKTANLKYVNTCRDYEGNDRVTLGKW